VINTKNTTRIGWAVAMLMSLAACGGGGNDGNAGSGSGSGTAPVAETPVGSSEPTPSRLSGVAATGAAFAGAALTVTDQTGATVCTTQTNDQGAYACDLPVGTKAPLVIRATRDDVSYYSTTASAATGTANVTPLTTIVVSQLSPDGNPASLAGAIVGNAAAVTADTIKSEVTQLLAALKPLLDALGQTGLDPMSGVFVADGTGADRVLDSIAVSVQSDGTAANIQITVKAVPGNGDATPLSISYSTADAAPPTLPPVDAAALVQPPTPATIASFLARMNACYALPLAQRVTAVNDGVNAIGTAADVVATACRTLFVGDDPSTYQANGTSVGRNANGRGAFESLFRAGPTGLVHDRGNFEFFRNGTDVVISYRWTDTVGNTDNDTLLLRNEGGVLKLTGNGNAYRVSVRPVAEKRELINAANFSYTATGYNVTIENRLDENFVPVLDKVVVTPPFGEPQTYTPKPGFSFLTVARPAGVAANASGSVIYLAGRYDNAATTGMPADKEANLNFVSPAFAESDVRALKDQSVWKLEFYRVGETVPSTTQSARTLARAPTLDEIKQLTFAEITPALREALRAETAGNQDNVLIFGTPTEQEPNLIDFSAQGDSPGWTVPTAALAPTLFSAYGRSSGVRWEDSVTVRNTARKAILTCSPWTLTDGHCATFSGVRQYRPGASLNTFELWARSARQVEMSTKIGLYSVQ